MKYVEVSVHQELANSELLVNFVAALRAARMLVQVCTSGLNSYQGFGMGGSFDSSPHPPDWGERVRKEGGDSASYHARKGDALVLVSMADRYDIGARGGAAPIISFFGSMTREEDLQAALSEVAEIISAINGS